MKSVYSDSSEIQEQASILTMLQSLTNEMKESRKETRKRFDGLDKFVEGISESIKDFGKRSPWLTGYPK